MPRYGHLQGRGSSGLAGLIPGPPAGNRLQHFPALNALRGFPQLTLPGGGATKMPVCRLENEDWGSGVT